MSGGRHGLGFRAEVWRSWGPGEEGKGRHSCHRSPSPPATEQDMRAPSACEGTTWVLFAPREGLTSRGLDTCQAYRWVAALSLAAPSHLLQAQCTACSPHSGCRGDDCPRWPWGSSWDTLWPQDSLLYSQKLSRIPKSLCLCGLCLYIYRIRNQI